MGVKVASGCLNWLQSSNYWPASSSPQTLASAISSPSTTRRSSTNVALVFRYVHRPAIFGAKLNRYRSFESRGRKSIKHVVSAGLDAEFTDDEFCKEIQELALIFQLSDDDDESNITDSDDILESETHYTDTFSGSKMEPPEWAGDMIPAIIERKANSVELPFSLRIIQKKKQWQEGFREVGESAYCSVKKAFSSMVFIIRELQSYTLQMREALFYEDLQGVLVRVQKEMNASFVWLFQQVFSHTPTLMMYVMILLANYSVYAMSNNVASAVAPPIVNMESISSIKTQSPAKIDYSSIITFPKISGKATSIGGINGGGGNSRPVASGTDGEESFNGAVSHHQKIVPDGTSSSSIINPSVSGQTTQEEESGLWKLIVKEADNMQDLIRYGVLDRQTMQRFISPVTAKIEEEDAEGHLRTELLYQMGLSEEPNNALLLANYAQFLYIIARDYDRAEEYFKRASKVEPKDAEALSKYANFLWEVRKDSWAAEETLLEAIAIDPINSFYAATYANFLWSNGMDEACFPVDPSENPNSDEL